MRLLINHLNYTAPCLASHLGFWMVEPIWFTQAVQNLRVGAIPVMTHEERIKQRKVNDDDRLFTLQGNTAIIELNDFLMKGESKFGGTSTVFTRQVLRQALMDKDVTSILLAVDSPGGTAAGTQALADDIRMAGTIKPVVAQISDLGASAAFWIASQASLIFANETAEIGSIGTIAVVEDTSQRAEKEGVEVHVISTGEFKGAFSDGAPVTEKQLGTLEQRVQDLNKPFLRSVQSSRKLSDKQLEDVSDGRVFIAQKAFQKGLIDGVQSIEATLDLVSGLGNSKSNREEIKSHDNLGLRIRLAESY